MIDIGQMVRSANPVSGDSALTDDELDALLRLIDTRSESMDIKEDLAPIKPPTPKRTPWLVAAATFVAVLVIGAAVLLTLPGAGDTSPARPTETTVPTATTTAPEPTVAVIVDEPAPAEEQVPTPTTSPALPDPTPDQIVMAQQVVDARNSGDFDAWSSLMTPDVDLAGPFSTRDLPTGGSEDVEFELDKVRDAMAFETALNAEWTNTGCRVADWTEAINWSTTVTQDSGPVLSCDLTYTDDLVKAGSQGDFELEMIVRGAPGAIDVYEIHYRSIDLAYAAWDPFLIWLETQSLDDALIAGKVEPGHRDEAWRGWVPKWTEESGNMVASYLDAYIASSG